MASRKPILNVLENESQVSKQLCSFIVDVANRTLLTASKFTIGLSGGSAANFLSEHLPNAETDWTKWHVFFCDERHVSYDDPECTFAYYDKHLFQRIPLPKENIYNTNSNVSVEDAACEYAVKIKEVFGDGDFPSFDILILGMGPDGHTCSLFPGHKLLEENSLWIAPISDSPKPPPSRVTMTMPVLLNAKHAVFAACGTGKATMVKRVIEGDETPPLPAAMVRPHSGDTYWFLDKSAAGLLSNL